MYPEGTGERLGETSDVVRGRVIAWRSMRTRGVLVAGAFALLAAGCAGNRPALSLSVTPSSALLDTPFRLRVTGLNARERVTIAASGHSHLGKVWRTVLKAQADSHGNVDLQNQYVIAQLRPVRKPATDDYLPWAQDLTVVVGAGNRGATARARRVLRPASVSITDERPRHVGFYGEWLTPRRTRRQTAILFLGGSEGGVPMYPIAYMLAAHGYPVLALAYFGAPGLPRTLQRIPLEYFRRALGWMRSRPEVDPQHIVTFGLSRGGELSLLLASTYRDLVHGAVGYAPSSLANVGLPAGTQPAWTDHGRPVIGGTIPVERIAGPVFVVGGGDDAIWPSGLAVDVIQQELRGHDPRDVTLVYPHAGHRAGGVPNIPELAATASSINGTLHFGGTPQADEAAREDSWPRLLRFLNGLSAS